MVPGTSPAGVLISSSWSFGFHWRFAVAATAHLNMPNGSFTSARVLWGKPVRRDLAFYLQLRILTGVRIVLSRRYFVTSVASPSWSRFFEEFHCRGCGAPEAYRSRPRGFFEKHVLPLLLLQPV